MPARILKIELMTESHPLLGLYGLDNFQKSNLLFNHDYNEPIGKIYNLRTDNKGLIIEATVSKNSGRIYNLIKEQVLTIFL